MFRLFCALFLISSSQLLGVSLAEGRLDSILKKQEIVLATQAANQDESHFVAAASADRLVYDLSCAYESLILDNPEYIDAYILYGKFLRQVGAEEKAYKVFLKAHSLDNSVAVIQQQLGNYWAEAGCFELALPHFLRAVELDPDVSIYHYQLGELLQHFREQILDAGALEEKILEEQMQAAFKAASELSPEVIDFAFRYGESFYDLNKPHWAEALAFWEKLESRALDEDMLQHIYLHEGRILLEMGKEDQARLVLDKVYIPHYEKMRRSMLTHYGT